MGSSPPARRARPARPPGAPACAALLRRTLASSRRASLRASLRGTFAPFIHATYETRIVIRAT